MPFQKVNILDIDFDNATMIEVIEQLKLHLKKEEKAFVVTGNPEIIMHAQQHRGYKSILGMADYTIPDGIGIVKASKLLKQPLVERVTGFDTLLRLMELADKNRLCVFLLGAEGEILEGAKQNIQKTYPHLKVVGSHHGYFDWKDGKIVNEIKRTKPDLVFVAMGFPRQEQWIGEHIHEFDKGVFIGVGGSFDILAGAYKRAPERWRNLSAEWLYRFLQRPTRGKRMLALPLFALRVMKQKVKGSK